MAKSNGPLITILILTGATFFITLAIWNGVSATEVKDMFGVNNQIIREEGAVHVVLPQDVDSVLSKLYKSTQEEFIFCLEGKVKNNIVLVEDLFETTIVERTNESLTFKPCRRTSKYLGTIHSHPQPKGLKVKASCGLSRQDVFTFAVADETITGVICGEGEYGFYDGQSLDESYTYEVKRNE